MTTDPKDRLEALVGQSVPRIAKSIGVDRSTLTRQLADGISADYVIRIARANQLAIIPALVAMEIITEAESNDVALEQYLRVANDRELLEELLRRVAEGEEQHPELVEPVPYSLVEEAHDNVTTIGVGGRPHDLQTAPWTGEEAASKDQTPADPDTRTP